MEFAEFMAGFAWYTTHTVSLAIAINHMARRASDRDVSPGQHDGVEVRIQGGAEGGLAGKGKRCPSLKSQAHGARRRGRHSRKKDIGTGLDGRADACIGRDGAVVLPSHGCHTRRGSSRRFRRTGGQSGL